MGLGGNPDTRNVNYSVVLNVAFSANNKDILNNMSKTSIKNIQAREILDSRGDPTLEVTVTLANGMTGTAGVPSGASTGVHEALELRDGDKARFDGKGVLKAVENVNTLVQQALAGKEVTKQEEIDATLNQLDGTANKGKLGANATVGVSLACARAATMSEGVPLYRYLADTFGYKAPYRMPLPMMNILNGGRHANNKLVVQEFMIIPQVRDSKGEVDITECVRVGAEVFHSLGRVLTSHQLDTDVGNEGGYAPQITTTTAALDLIMQAIRDQHYTPGKEVSLALDVAASEFYESGGYQFESWQLKSDEMIRRYEDLLRPYPIVSIEDGLAEDDWAGWQKLTARLGDRILLVGDDIFVTNVDRITQAIEQKVGNAAIIKSNQIGTLSESVAAIKLAQTHAYKVVISHRSGETMDPFIADLAVAVGADYLKAGSTSRGERVAKYNRLMEIAAELK